MTKTVTIDINSKLLGRKGKTINMSVVDSRAISTNWYLYVYIDEHLTTANNHTLPDSLIFIDNDSSIKTLGTTPVLVYSGTPNDGNTKTTDISWKEDSGILFKIIEPLYNGEKYTTMINWMLSNEVL